MTVANNELDGARTSIRFRSARRWLANPRSGSFVAYLDGRRVGRLFPGESLTVNCEPGDHFVRIRQMWLTSPDLTVKVQEGSSCGVVADIPRNRSVLGL